jgi:hypothetical protein
MLPQRSTLATDDSLPTTGPQESQKSLSSQSPPNPTNARLARGRSIYSLDMEELIVWDDYFNAEKGIDQLIRGPSLSIRLCRALHSDFMNLLSDHLNHAQETQVPPEDQMVFLSKDTGLGCRC